MVRHRDHGTLSSEKGRIRQLDGVRGIAVLLVLVHNTDLYPSLHLGFVARNGWMGVDLFFVLSGFLITGILWDSKREENYFRNFYVRRALRILPLYYSALVFMFVLVPLVVPSERASIFNARSAPWWAYPLFLQNFLVRVPTNATGLLAVTWSLAVEEQFYVIWPLVVRVCGAVALRRLAVGILCLSPVLRIVLGSHGVLLYSNPLCRLDGLMAGALLALLVRSHSFDGSRFVPRAWIVFGAAGALAVWSDQHPLRWIVFSFVAFAAAAFVFLALFSRQEWLRTILASRFLVFTGGISYGIYILEKIPLDVVEKVHLGAFPLPVFLAATATTYLLALASWSFLEKPFLRLKRHWIVRGSYDRRPDVSAEFS